MALLMILKLYLLESIHLREYHLMAYETDQLSETEMLLCNAPSLAAVGWEEHNLPLEIVTLLLVETIHLREYPGTVV